MPGREAVVEGIQLLEDECAGPSFSAPCCHRRPASKEGSSSQAIAVTEDQSFLGGQLSGIAGPRAFLGASARRCEEW